MKQSKMYQKILALMLVVVFLFTITSGVFATNKQFSDVPKTHWAYSDIMTIVNGSYAGGYSDGTFKPNQSITRAEYMKMINGIFKYTSKAQINFKDVKSSDWYYNTVAVAVKAGYASGYSDSTIKPNNNITRAEAASMLSRVLDLEGDSIYATTKFTDYKSIPSWALSAVGAVSKAGAMGGYSDGSFGSLKNISRAETSSAILKSSKITPGTVVGNTYTSAGTFGPTSGAQTITGDVNVKAAGVYLQNMKISGNLYIDAAVSSGTTTLSNVTVTGSVYINGGGSRALSLNNSTVYKAYIQKSDAGIYLLSTDSKVTNTYVKANGYLRAISTATIGFQNVDIESSNTSLDITKALLDQLNVNNGTATVTGDSNTIINTMTVNYRSNFKGQFTTKVANINISNVTYDKMPTKINLKSGVSYPTSSNSSDVKLTARSGNNLTRASIGSEVLVLTLEEGTFNTSLSTSNFYLNNAPSGISIDSVSRRSNTQVYLYLKGSASMSKDINNFYVTVRSSGFSGSSDINSNSLTVSYNNNSFNLALSLRSGSLTTANIGSQILVLDLSNDTFVNSLSTSNFRLNNAPSGISIDSVSRRSNTQVYLYLRGTASSVSSNITDFSVTARSSALVNGTDIESTYLTITAAKQLIWNDDTFNESVNNDGSISNEITVYLNGEDFSTAISNGTDFTYGTHYSYSNLPAGLSVTITKNRYDRATIRILGKANNHTSAYNISNFTISFNNYAFENRSAGSIDGYYKNNLKIRFIDSASIDATVSPSVANMTINSQTSDISFTVTPNSKSFVQLKDGANLLTSGVDYNYNSSTNVLTLKMAYLNNLSVGNKVLTIDMNSGSDPTITIVVNDVVENSQIAKQGSSTYNSSVADKMLRASATGNYVLGFKPNGNTVNIIKVNNAILSSSNYIINSSVTNGTIEFTSTFLNSLANGQYNIEIDMDKGQDPEFVLTVYDNAIFTGASAGTYTNGDASHQIGISWNGDTVASVSSELAPLLSTDYELSGSGITLKATYLLTLSNGVHTITINNRYGNPLTYSITVQGN